MRYQFKVTVESNCVLTAEWQKVSEAKCWLSVIECDGWLDRPDCRSPKFSKEIVGKENIFPSLSEKTLQRV